MIVTCFPTLKSNFSVQTAVSCLEDNPSSCSSAERCLLHLLERLVTSSYKLKQSVQPPDKYDQILNSLNQTPAVPKSQVNKIRMTEVCCIISNK